MVEQPQKDKQEDKQEVKHGPGWCKLCQQQIPLGEYKKFSAAFLIHKHKAHKKEMDAQSAKGTAQSVVSKKAKADAAAAEKLKAEQEEQEKKKKEEAAKAAPPSDPGKKPEGDGNKKDGLKEGGDMTSIRQPAHGAIQFKMGTQEIIIDPAELYDAFMYYRDMVAHQNIHEPFTKVLKTSIKYIWELLNRQQAREQPASITPKIGVDKDPFEETLDLASKVAELRIIESVGHYP